MDRTGTCTRGGPGREGGNPSPRFVLPSRAAALAALKAGLDAGDGPVLLTGDAGVGKSWLGRQLRAQVADRWNWAALDLSASLDPSGLYRLTLRALGLTPPREPLDPASARIALEDALSEATADGRAWGLLVDDVENGRDAVLEELRALSNRLGEPDGFAGLVLAGQTSLSSRLARRPLVALGARVGTRVHLRPLELEEVRLYLGQLGPVREREVAVAERVHRAVAGNPRQVFRLLVSAVREAPPSHALAAPARVRSSAPARRPEPPEPERAPARPAVAMRTDLAEVVPVRPPLEVSDEVVEVGWEPALDAENVFQPEPSKAPTVDRAEGPATILTDPDEADEPDEEPTPRPVEDEVVEDRYAALQAWRELAQVPTRPPAGPARDDDLLESTRSLTGLSFGTTTVHGAADGSNSSGFTPVRLEDQHGFAPYSQLFSRLRHSRDTP